MAEHQWEGTEGGTGFIGHTCTVCGVWAPGEPGTAPNDGRPCPGDTSIFIRIEADHTLRAGDVWPDGDYPDVIDASAVKAVMEQFGSKHHVCSDWSLDFDVFVSIGRQPDEVQVWR